MIGQQHNTSVDVVTESKDNRPFSFTTFATTPAERLKCGPALFNGRYTLLCDEDPRSAAVGSRRRRKELGKAALPTPLLCCTLIEKRRAEVSLDWAVVLVAKVLAKVCRAAVASDVASVEVVLSIIT